MSIQKVSSWVTILTEPTKAMTLNSAFDNVEILIKKD